MEKQDPLVTTDWLAAHLDDEKVRVVDIRGYVDKTDLGGGPPEGRLPRRPRGVRRGPHPRRRLR